MQQYALVFPFLTHYKGWGLAAGEDIKAGSFIIEYVGEVFSVYSKFGETRMKKYEDMTVSYLMKSSSDEIIDATKYGNMARFINHSCDPNCQTQKWTVLGEVCVGIYSLKDIKKGEELTFDYQFDTFETTYSRCFCGTKKCKGFLGIKPINEEQKEELVSSIACMLCKMQRKDQRLPNGKDATSDDMKVYTLGEGTADAESPRTYIFVLCSKCRLPYHIKCLHPKSIQKEVKRDSAKFKCHNCVKLEEEEMGDSDQSIDNSMFIVNSAKMREARS